jgi:sec-independent protein translocase protein TatA
VLVFFGSKKIPELAQGIGKGIREFKKATSDAQDDENEAKKIEQKPADEKKG